MKYYAVRNGREGNKIYDTWQECQKNIEHVRNVRFKRFGKKSDALDFIKDETDDENGTTPIDTHKAVAYVDGSFNIHTNEFACGVVILHDNKETRLSMKFENPVMAKLRNVAGEIKGALMAIDWALRNDVKSIDIYYDYQGIGAWPDGQWQANVPETQAYVYEIAKARMKMEIDFVKVKGHSGNKYNDVADRLAKDALGIK